MLWNRVLVGLQEYYRGLPKKLSTRNPRSPGESHIFFKTDLWQKNFPRVLKMVTFFCKFTCHYRYSQNHRILWITQKQFKTLSQNVYCPWFMPRSWRYLNGILTFGEIPQGCGMLGRWKVFLATLGSKAEFRSYDTLGSDHMIRWVQIIWYAGGPPLYNTGT